MMSFLRNYALGAILSVLWIGSAHAVLVETDYLLAGDSLITRDTGSGLEWLDTSFTTGRSFNDVSMAIGTVGDNLFGWRYASLSEVENLWINAGIDTSESTWTPINYLAVKDLTTLLGATNIALNGEEISAMVSDTIGSTNALSLPRMFYDGSTQEARATLTAFGSFPDSAAYGGGSYLVRTTSAPEPTTLALMGLGLAGLGFARKKIV